MEKRKYQKYTPESLAEIAKKYGEKTAFSKNDNAAYCAAIKHGILDQICSHMVRPKRKKLYTDEQLMDEVKKYNSLNELLNKNRKLYMAIRERFGTKALAHLRVNRDLSYENLIRIAKQFKTRSEFRKGDVSAYNLCIMRKCLDDICSHMNEQEENHEVSMH